MRKDIEEISYNKICLKCRKKCKQYETAVILHCPHFEAMEVQLEIVVPGFGKPLPKKKK